MGTLSTLEPRLHSPPATRTDLEPARPGRRQRLVLEPRLHTEPFGTEPYYDEELDVMTLEPHRIAIGWLFATLEHRVAAALGLRFASDHPIWYESVEGQQRVLRPDAILLRKDAELRRATSRQVLFALEVVSTNDRRKELKDTVSMKSINELNEVPEFALFYPDLEDSRCFEMFRLEETTHAYAPVHVVDGRFVSVAIPGLELVVLPRAEWSDGRKMDVYFRGERCLRTEEALARAREERGRADEERKRADEARKRADEESRRADEESRRADEESRRADEESRRADEERKRAEVLAAKLRELGLNPDSL